MYQMLKTRSSWRSWAPSKFNEESDRALYVDLALGLLPYGIALIDHSLLAMELQPQTTVADLRERDQMSLLFEALQIGEELLDSFGSVPSKGYIWQVKEGRFKLLLSMQPLSAEAKSNASKCKRVGSFRLDGQKPLGYLACLSGSWILHPFDPALFLSLTIFMWSIKSEMHVSDKMATIHQVLAQKKRGLSCTVSYRQSEESKEGAGPWFTGQQQLATDLWWIWCSAFETKYWQSGAGVWLTWWSPGRVLCKGNSLQLHSSNHKSVHDIPSLSLFFLRKMYSIVNERLQAAFNLSQAFWMLNCLFLLIVQQICSETFNGEAWQSVDWAVLEGRI